MVKMRPTSPPVIDSANERYNNHHRWQLPGFPEGGRGHKGGLMKTTAFGACLVLVAALIVLVTGIAWGGMAVPVSPGDAHGSAVTAQTCPTFSWSFADGAISYRIEVYEQLAADIVAREMMQIQGPLVLQKEIAAPALSWTPSAGECLARGKRYVWYVEGLTDEGSGRWSAGMGFQVDESPLSIEQQIAVGK
jgi:hypothetical protein